MENTGSFDGDVEEIGSILDDLGVPIGGFDEEVVGGHASESKWTSGSEGTMDPPLSSNHDKVSVESMYKQLYVDQQRLLTMTLDDCFGGGYDYNDASFYIELYKERCKLIMKSASRYIVGYDVKINDMMSQYLDIISNMGTEFDNKNILWGTLCDLYKNDAKLQAALMDADLRRFGYVFKFELKCLRSKRNARLGSLSFDQQRLVDNRRMLAMGIMKTPWGRDMMYDYKMEYTALAKKLRLEPQNGEIDDDVDNISLYHEYVNDIDNDRSWQFCVMNVCRQSGLIRAQLRRFGCDFIYEIKESKVTELLRELDTLIDVV